MELLPYTFKWIEVGPSDEGYNLRVVDKNLYKDAGDYIVMIVAKPNAKKDYHYNETEELFFSVRGNYRGTYSRGWPKENHEIKCRRYVFAPFENTAFSCS